MIIPPNVNAHSYLLGRGDAERDARIRTIRAIRCAAEVAREYDLYCDAATEFKNTDVAIAWARRAGDVRRAIRSAIGSTKS